MLFLCGISARVGVCVPEPLFHVPFDGTAEARTAGGRAAPLAARGLVFEAGVAGQAVRLTADAQSRLEYALEKNCDPARGTVALWYKPEWAEGAEDRWRHLFGFTAPWDRQRVGSGAVYVWHYGAVLRGDTSDTRDAFVSTRPRRKNGEWRHIAFTWDDTDAALYVDGKAVKAKRDSENPLKEALLAEGTDGGGRRVADRPRAFASFHVGGTKEGRQADGLIDELKVFAVPLAPAQIAALAAEHRPQPPPEAVWVPRAVNPYVSAGEALDLRLVETLTLDTLPDAERFVSTGGHTFGALGGVRYLEAGTNKNDRFAVRFRLPDAGPLYCFEWDFPDDKRRTADIIVQPSAGVRGNYELQVGYMTGDEYPCQQRTLTARCLYWAPTQDVAVVFMTAREGAPAAVSRIRLYKVEGGLPAAKILAPEPVDGWRRTVGLYYEDPAINYNFAADGGAMPGFETLIERTAAYMKYTGQDLFCYPGVWYHGRIGEDYNPRGHAENFLKAWYVKFDAEGLGVMPTFNQQTLPLPDGMKISKASLSDGSLHDTCVSVWDTGMPNPGGWHGTPPNFNILHPHTQKVIMEDVEALIAQGAAHPSFRGIDLRLAEHCFHWLGSIRAGYNDYMIDAFTAETGIRVPVDHADPLRGKAYAEWLLANAREEWVAWRCRAVAAWHKRLAARLAQARPDLRLSLTLLTPMHPTRGEAFDGPDYIGRLNREAGIDARLYADTPNIVISQGLRPARFRAGYDRPKTDAERTFLREVFDTPGYYADLSSARLPWLHLHDHYWESAVGNPARRGKADKPLEAPWFREDPWRVTTLNPASFQSMRPYVLPLRYHDLLGITRGGFLVGTYGMEAFLIPFAKAFRALPAKRFGDIAGSTEAVKVRALSEGGKTWFYAVNTGDVPAGMTLATDTADVTDLMTGGRPAELDGRRLALTLAPYQLRSFCAEGDGVIMALSLPDLSE